MFLSFNCFVIRIRSQWMIVRGALPTPSDRLATPTRASAALTVKGAKIKFKFETVNSKQPIEIDHKK